VAKGSQAPVDSKQPTVVKHGPISFLLLERNEALAMRIKDEQAETRTGFQGTELFAFDPALQIEAHWDGSAAHCDIGGRRYNLRPLNPQANPLHFVIGDTTSGTLSYGGGRFLYVQMATSEPGPIMLDLNRAINPPCAFTAFALCPVPPPDPPTAPKRHTTNPHWPGKSDNKCPTRRWNVPPQSPPHCGTQKPAAEWLLRPREPRKTWGCST
jgi:hypothetical protein